MKSETKKAIIWTVVIVLLIAVALTLQWYHSPGVHMLGPMVRIELSQKCFIMDADTGEILEESFLQVYMDGNLWNGNASGMAKVDGYPVEGKGLMGVTLADRKSAPDAPTKVAICAYTPEEAQARLPKIVECIFGIAENP